MSLPASTYITNRCRLPPQLSGCALRVRTKCPPSSKHFGRDCRRITFIQTAAREKSRSWGAVDFACGLDFPRSPGLTRLWFGCKQDKTESHFRPARFAFASLTLEAVVIASTVRRDGPSLGVFRI